MKFLIIGKREQLTTFELFLNLNEFYDFEM